MKYNSSKKGFTLVELLIVIVIIAVLSVGAITVFPQTQARARNARRRNDILAISKALESRYNNSANEYCGSVAAPVAAGTYCGPVAGWFSANAIPVDPATGASYTGLPVNGAATYSVCATLEAIGTTPAGTFCRAAQQQ